MRVRAVRVDFRCTNGYTRALQLPLKTPFFATILFVSAAIGGDLHRYGELVRADAVVGRAPRGLRITYLGTNAYLLEGRDATLLVDPYFSRQSLVRAAFNLRVAAQPELVENWLRDHPQIDAVLVTHGHVDHLLDVPQILRRTGAQLIASETSAMLVRSTGISTSQLHVVRPGETVNVRGATIRVRSAAHDRVFGSIPFRGPPRHLPPRNVGDWVLGAPLAFAIELGGRRIFINSGSMPGHLIGDTGRVDLAVLGVGTPDSVRAFPEEIRQLRPRFVLPSHQDNFFRPLSRGFAFLPLTNFPAVRAAAQAQGCEVVLLDYFRPWTLP